MLSRVYLDLDRTLLDTSRVSKDIWAELGRQLQIDVSKQWQREDLFYVWPELSPGSYYYDFGAHLDDAGVDRGEATDLLSSSPLADDSLLLPGAVNLVERLRSANVEVEILTFGDDFYQRQIKVMLCPALKDLPVNVTDRHKGIFLANKGGAVLVDDKDLRGELPSEVRFIWVQLEGKERSVDDDGAVKSLDEVGDIVLGLQKL